MEWVDSLIIWFLNIGENYGVNPFIFGIIYVGAIPLFTLSIAWLVRNFNRGFSIVLPVLCATFFFISAYLYLMIAGENVPLWVYGIVIIMLLYGILATYKKVIIQINEENAA